MVNNCYLEELITLILYPGTNHRYQYLVLFVEHLHLFQSE
jgi:hypothetical protein